MKAQIKNFSSKFTNYGHWLVTLTAENPALLLADNDYYWQMNERSEEPSEITLTHTTTNSRAIDGHDGYEVALASECLRANEWDVDMFDLTSLKNSDTE